MFGVYNINFNHNNYLVSKKFEQLSIKPGFMKHNGGLLFRNISKNEYEFKTKIDKNHLNMAGITHGGYMQEHELVLTNQQAVSLVLLFR